MERFLRVLFHRAYAGLRLGIRCFLRGHIQCRVLTRNSVALAKFKMWRNSGGTKPGFLRYWKVITFLFLNNPFTNNKHLLDEVFVISGIIKSR